ncbi:nuclear envelope morphology [Scheffersomyces xylosifermentans]|uniref:nuclear envelope morphology n=1 Tax=Scheffersomyces xylosifermentans TaxID=1304137 RepID=UPI00315D3BEE
MNSLKIIVNSLDTIYPNKTKYEIPPNPIDQDAEDDEDIDDNGEINLSAASATANSNNSKNNAPYTNINSTAKTHSNYGIKNSTKVLSFTFQAVIFFPKFLIYKPLSFLWLLITFPFVYTLEQLGLITRGNESSLSIPEEDEEEEVKGPIKRSNTSDTPEIRSEIDEKTEILKQENILSNNIKSPTSSSRYMIPPPQRLYPLSRNPNKKRKRKTLILDLDETLIHSLSRGSPRSFNSSSSSAPKMIEIKLNNIASLYYVHKRPFCDYFLKEISKWFELQIFTASVKEYADPIIDWLESDILDNTRKRDAKEDAGSSPRKIFTKRYYRSDCTYRQGVGYIKDLSKFFAKDDDLKNVIILDNSPVSYALHEDNAVMIEGWINDQRDRDLLHLLPMLHSLSLCIDVRFILGLRNGEKSFER